MKTVGVQEAEVRLRDPIQDAIDGKEVFIVKSSSQMVQLVPIEPTTRRPQFGSAKGLIELADDFAPRRLERVHVVNLLLDTRLPVVHCWK